MKKGKTVKPRRSIDRTNPADLEERGKSQFLEDASQIAGKISAERSGSRYTHGKGGFPTTLNLGRRGIMENEKKGQRRKHAIHRRLPESRQPEERQRWPGGNFRHFASKWEKKDAGKRKRNISKQVSETPKSRSTVEEKKRV